MDSTILQILAKHNLTATPELLAAMKEVYMAAIVDNLDSGPAPEAKETLSARDAADLRALGIDPDKKFRIRSSVFTIVGYKPSRWKFPVSAVTQNGTRYKFTIAQVKQNQM